MLFINNIVQNINVGLDQIFTIDDLQLFLMLYADDAVVFAKSPEALQSYRIILCALGVKGKHSKNEVHDIRER